MRRLVVLALATLAVLLLVPARAEAHPLGKFSVNQSLQVTVRADAVTMLAVIDLAELPTLADKPTASAARTCAEVAANVTVKLDGIPAAWRTDGVTLAYAAGAAGLETSRYECRLTASAAKSTVDISNGYLTDRVGWREIVVAGEGTAVDAGGLPATSPTNGLRDYPQDLLASPLDTRTAAIQIGRSGSAAVFAALPSGSSWTTRAEQTLEGIVGDGNLGLTGVLLAFVLATLLGAAHAALPGHGKTVMAAYLAGRSGRPRDALLVGATVTFTHTVGVLVLGLLITAVAGIAGEHVLRWLGIASGVVVLAVGAGLLARSRHAHHHHHEHEHRHQTGTHNDRPRSRLSLAGLGVAGGLVPSPTALVVLLAAIGLGRGVLGVTLVLAYGAGMAATLTAAGLLVLEIRRRGLKRWPRPGRWAHRLQHALPPVTAAVILLAGATLILRSIMNLRS
ncbi:ABC-type nickel/cobalt efflux system permease component RcnA [Hamadaea flava]|uniref:Nickel/cobalt transporter n=1 Tax=Hamadaea flava TaxID=1742688 RepID=A0ABV8LZM5_9ACTN|nr:sulfite exporter TauE/SafE family protein [Hamadaea flava]MCP2328859.1 ABC-type nickel/cobalt efflux system permease component RcnA [Hamadaea flava]